ncbi:MAG: hypothetical protein QF415_15370 [Candidatus Undinarchaeales archaeon]|jgi:hypothetical protein|nr:hypothetical protein [Candidatus Undinarchaeales archaeon]MDP7494442.1 hypothetical protein [Candidatus Undinarchaeales archaeon]
MTLCRMRQAGIEPVSYHVGPVLLVYHFMLKRALREMRRVKGR